MKGPLLNTSSGGDPEKNELNRHESNYWPEDERHAFSSVCHEPNLLEPASREEKRENDAAVVAELRERAL